METFGTKLEKLFYESYNHVDEEEIIKLYNRNFDGGVANVVNSLHPNSYSLWWIEDKPNLKYQLVHVNGDKNLEGNILNLTHNQQWRDELVFFFSNFIAHNYSGLDTIDVFNTFQDHARGFFESKDFYTVTNIEMEKFKNQSVSILAPHKRGIIPVRIIEKASFFKDFFRTPTITETEEQVYLMLNRRNNLIKIGSSRKPGYREKTLQADEPEVRLIASWVAPNNVERELHKQFKEKRVRGEWFKLSFNDLKKVKTLMANRAI